MVLHNFELPGKKIVSHNFFLLKKSPKNCQDFFFKIYKLDPAQYRRCTQRVYSMSPPPKKYIPLRPHTFCKKKKNEEEKTKKQMRTPYFYKLWRHIEENTSSPYKGQGAKGLYDTFDNFRKTYENSVDELLDAANDNHEDRFWIDIDHLIFCILFGGDYVYFIQVYKESVNTPIIEEINQPGFWEYCVST